jgi:hypothetical protein
MDKSNSQILLYEFSTAFPDPPKSFDMDNYKRWVNNVENQLGITISKESKDKAEELQKENIDGKDDSYFPSFYYITETVTLNYKNELTDYLFKNYHNTIEKYAAGLYEYENIENEDGGIAKILNESFISWLNSNEKRLLDNYENERFYKDKELEDKLDKRTIAEVAKDHLTGQKYYKLQLSKYTLLEQIVKANNESDACEFANELEFYEIDTTLGNDLTAIEYSYFEPTE